MYICKAKLSYINFFSLKQQYNPYFSDIELIKLLAFIGATPWNLLYQGIRTNTYIFDPVCIYSSTFTQILQQYKQA